MVKYNVVNGKNYDVPHFGISILRPHNENHQARIQMNSI